MSKTVKSRVYEILDEIRGEFSSQDIAEKISKDIPNYRTQPRRLARFIASSKQATFNTQTRIWEKINNGKNDT